MAVQTLSATGEPLPPRRRRGCLARFLITLVLLLIIIGAVWFLALRPYLHNIAQTQIDRVLNDAVDQMPEAVALLPPGPFTVQENTINNLIVLQSAPSDTVQHIQAHITSNGIRVDFQVYGFACAVTGIPQARNGHLVVTNVNVEGIASLIMSPDEMAATINRHLTDAQKKLNHSIESVQLGNQELGMMLGPIGFTP